MRGSLYSPNNRAARAGRVGCAHQKYAFIAVLAAGFWWAQPTLQAFGQSLAGLELLDAALIASQVDLPEERQAYLRRFDELRQSLVRQGIARQAPLERARRIHRLLHERALGVNYDVRACRFDVALDGGGFNCVSATLAFIALADAFDLTVTPVAKPGHVYCRLELYDAAGSAVAHRLELTEREWRHAFLPAKPLADLRREAARGGHRELSREGLLGKLEYNVGWHELQQNRFETALRHLHRAAEADPLDEPTRRNLLAGYNNWAVALCESGDYRGALARIEQGLAIDPTFAPLVANRRLVLLRSEGESGGVKK